MESISQIIEFLNCRRRFHLSQYNRKLKYDTDSANKHKSTANQFSEAIDFLENLEINQDADAKDDFEDSLDSNNPPELQDKSKENQDVINLDIFSFSASEIESLPDTVKTTLNLSDSDELSGKIIELIQIAGRPLSVKELIIGLYKKYGVEITERNPFASKLYRMCQTGTLKSVEGKRGYYYVPERK